jgi:hypothetical protein
VPKLSAVENLKNFKNLISWKIYLLENSVENQKGQKLLAQKFKNAKTKIKGKQCLYTKFDYKGEIQTRKYWIVKKAVWTKIGQN